MRLAAIPGTSCNGSIYLASGAPEQRFNFTTTDQPLTLTVFAYAGGGWVPGTPEDLNDNDSVSPVIETQVPSRDQDGATVPDSTGDGNGDGTPDAQQKNVTSVPILGGSVGDTRFVTIASPADTKLTNALTLDPERLPIAPPEGQVLPEGLSQFIVTGVPAGEDVVVSIFTESTAGVTGYAKYDPESGWTTLSGDRVTIVNDHRVDIRLTDGGEGDADGEVDGQVDDPGGLLVTPDTESPTVTVTGVADGARYRIGSVPSAGCAATDNLALTAPCAAAFESTNGTSLGVHTYTASATDGAGNTTTTSVTYTVFDDEEAPLITIHGLEAGQSVDGELRFLLGQEPTPTCHAEDEGGGSGVAGDCELEQTSGPDNGVGLYTWQATATDNAGNVADEVVSYRVVYRFDGFAQPINDPRLTTAPRSVFKAGSTVPVKFQLKRADGTMVTPSAAPTFEKSFEETSGASVNEATTSASASSGTMFTYANGWWHYNWKTAKADANKAFEIGAVLDDGTRATVMIGLR